jgi:hypothetical protein
MNKFTLLLSILFTIMISYGQAIKFDVPSIKFGENQSFNVLSYEALADGKYSIFYAQELSAGVKGEKEFFHPNNVGAFTEPKNGKYIPYSERVLLLTRQTIDAKGASNTDFWVLALRELSTDDQFTMFFPPNFAHPIISDKIPIKNSLKHMEQLKDLTAREYEALTLLGKEKYSFYDYPTAKVSYRRSTFNEDWKQLGLELKQLKAMLGKGDLPKDEKLMFKREIVEKTRFAVMRSKEVNDSFDLKLYLSNSDDSKYELQESKKYSGSVMPNTDILVRNSNLEVSAAFGYLLHKFKDEKGEDQSKMLAIGIDDNGESQFWDVYAGKNKLSSFVPKQSWINEDGIYVLSDNAEKVFKPYNQLHLLKRDGTAKLLYPLSEQEVNSEKTESLTTIPEEPKSTNAFGHSSSFSGSSGGYSSVGAKKNPLIINKVNGTQYLTYQNENTTTANNVHTTTFGELVTYRIDDQQKLTTISHVTVEPSSKLVNVIPLAKYKDSQVYILEFGSKMKLVFNKEKFELVPLDSKTMRTVPMISREYISYSDAGAMLLTKTIIGNGYSVEFYPSK